MQAGSSTVKPVQVSAGNNDFAHLKPKRKHGITITEGYDSEVDTDDMVRYGT